MVYKRKIMIGLRILFAMMALGFIVWSFMAEPEAYPIARADYRIANTGWNQVIDGEEISLADIREFIETDDENLVFTRTVHDVKTGDVVLFYAWNQEVQSYINGTCIQDFVIQERFRFLKTPGCAWNQIDMTSDMNGATFTLVLGNVGQGNVQVVPNIYLVEDVDVGIVRMQEIGFRIIVTVLLLLMAVSSFVNLRIWRSDIRRKYYMAFAHLYLNLFCWLLAELNAFELVFHRPITSYLLAMMFVRMIPLSLFYVMIPRKVISEKWRKIIHTLILGNIFGAFVLQFFFGISLLETVWVNTLLIGLIMLICIGIIIRKLFWWKNIKKNDYYYLLMGILVIGGMLDLVTMIVVTGPTRWSGIYSVIACVVYFIITNTLVVHRNSEMVIEKAEMEEYYQKLQTISLMEQMKSHFIFNTLNGISELCKQDGATEADAAIKLFAKYLRAYMYLINQQDNISFEKEMELVGAYLAIEKLRFEEMLEFEVDLEYTDFMIPPLSIQPIVENAVLHGVRQRSGIGNIRMTSKRYYNIVKVVIEDNGVGFDVSEVEEGTSIGIQNMKKRMELLVDGTVEIQSVIGKGTRVVITIPLSEEK